MLHPSTKKLIDRLAQMTAQQKISWVLGERENSIAYETEGYRVLLDGDPPSLRLTDALGAELETADHSLLSDTSHADGGTYSDVVANLHAEAFRVARGTESAISAVLQGLADTASETDDSALSTVDLAPNKDEADETPAEPDTVEDVADEAGIEADIPDVGKAVATLADQVNNGGALEETSEDSVPAAISEDLSTDIPPPILQPTEADVVSTSDEPPNQSGSVSGHAPPIQSEELAPPVEENETSESDATTLPEPVPSTQQQRSTQPRRNIGAIGGFGDLASYKRQSQMMPPPAAEPESDQSASPADAEPLDRSQVSVENPETEPAPPAPQATVRSSNLPPNVQAILDEVTASPPDGPPLPPPSDNKSEVSAADEEASSDGSIKQNETLSLSGITAGLGSVQSEDTVAPEPEQQSSPPAQSNQEADAAPPSQSSTNSDEVQEEEAEVDDTSAGSSPNSRFNPWM
ncbi:MAG: hypothetical protein AAF583_03735 [Pseudomonadota bacterium]